MGAVDCERQALNVYRMKMLGAEVVPVHAGPEDAQGSRQRSDARLGDQRPQHALHPRHGLRLASVSGDGAEFPARHRRRSAPADSGKGRAPARPARRLRRRRLERHRPVLSVPRRCEREDGRRGSGWRGIMPEQHAARFQGGSLGVLQGTRSYILQDDVRPDPTHPQRQRRTGLRRRRAGTRLAARRRAAWNTPTPPTTRRSKPS